MDHLKFSGFYMECLEAWHALYPKVLELIETPRYVELKGSFIDLSNAFDGDDYILIDQCHVSPNGNEIIARSIYDYISAKYKME